VNGVTREPTDPSRSRGGLVVSPLLLISALVWVTIAAPCEPARAQPSPGQFGIVPDSFEAALSSTEAGAHADLAFSLELAHDEEGHTVDDPRTASFDLPAGLVGNPSAVPVCTQAEFLAGERVPECPPASQVGTIAFEGHLLASAVYASLPLYNLAPSQPGLPAELGFRLVSFAQHLPLEVRPQDSGLTVSARDILANLEPRRLSVDIWGVPAAPVHDPVRGRWCLLIGVGDEPNCEGGEQAAEISPLPFLANPTGCGPAEAEVHVVSWEEPTAWSTAQAEVGPIADCASLPFEPRIDAGGTTTSTESPSGFDISLVTPTDWSDPNARVAAVLRDAKIPLPAGFSLNPAFAAGLRPCSSVELAGETAQSASSQGCPAASIIGSVEARSPILAEPARGHLYLATPFDNPTGARVAVYAVATAPKAGIQFEMTAKLDLDPQTGHPTLVVEDAPQLPLERLDLALGEGGSMPLVTPASCGDAGGKVELRPWSTPAESRLLQYAVSIDRGPAGGQPCGSAATQPFHPRLSAASTRPRAGTYSAFQLRITREDGEAQLQSLDLELPPGLAARLGAAGICPEPDLAAARARAPQLEREDPSCPPASALGDALFEAGVGGSLARLPGRIYLAGPDAGSRLSVAVVTPVLLGPYDLGTIMVREPLLLDPRTGALAIGRGGDPLPLLIDGFPLRLRGVELDFDRPELIRNPTSCRTLAVRAIAGGIASGGQALTADLSEPYRVKGCRQLAFDPVLRIGMLGTTARNGHPGLRALFISHPYESTLASASIAIPRDLLFDPSRLGAGCAEATSAPRSCPPRSVIGRARATSPLLDEPLHGRIYLRRNPKTALPDLVVELRNGKVGFQLTQRLRMSRFGLRVVSDRLPDLPISRLVLVIAGGRRGLLVRSSGFCHGHRGIGVRLTAHNRKVSKQRVSFTANCPRSGR
jgi:hypothetical protein